MCHTNHSCRPLLPFHPDNAPPSKAKTSPVTNPTLSARLIFEDYPFKCPYLPNINPDRNRAMASSPKTTNTAISTNQGNLNSGTRTSDGASPKHHINRQRPSRCSGGGNRRRLIKEFKWHFSFKPNVIVCTF